MTYIPSHLNALTDDELISNFRCSNDPLVALLVERLSYLQADLEAEIESHIATQQELEDLEEELRDRIAELEAEVAKLEGELENVAKEAERWASLSAAVDG